MNGQSPLQQVWQRILMELAHLQEQAPQEMRGHVVNPISNMVYYRDTAFAARVFATEYRLTGQHEWGQRARAAIDALFLLDLFSGFEEPIWNRYGWHWKKGSLPATAMLLDSLWTAMGQLGMEHEVKDNSAKLLDYLQLCMIEPGLFAHDAIQGGARPVPVLNTTAMALLLMEYMVARGMSSAADRSRIEKYISKTRAILYRGQRPDGFWPYVYPNLVQRAGFNLWPIRLLTMRFQKVRHAILKSGDRSILFVDAVHNGYDLYFLIKSLLVRGMVDQADRTVIVRGWHAIRGRLVQPMDETVRYDFSDEPRLSSPRYCSFFSTSVYFLILAIIAMLEKLGIDGPDLEDLGTGIVGYIENCLLERPGVYPCIRSNEGPEEFTRNILPHVGESVAFKGACLSDWMLRAAQVA